MTIDGVICEMRGPDHQDARRELRTAFNGDLGEFVARQVKFTTMLIDAYLGGHYHEYRELFYMLKGKATFDLVAISTGEREQYVLKVGARLLIPPHVAHKALVKQGSILVGCTEESYVSSEVNDHKYEFT